MKGITMFSSAGIGELMLEDIGFSVAVANERIEKRGELYKKIYPKSKMIIGDIQNPDVFKEFATSLGRNVRFLIASPPCQGIIAV